MDHKEFLGTKLSLKTSSSIESQFEFELSSVFEELVDDEHILIAAPIHKGTIFPTSLQETLYVYFFNEKGRFDFTCVVVERPIINNIYYLKVLLTSEVTRSQRRDYFRVRKSIRAKVALSGTLIVDAQNHPDAKHVDGLTGTVESDCMTHDISASGLCVNMTHSCELSDLVVISLPVGPNEEIVHFMSEVVWVGPSDKPGYAYTVGLRFIYENEKDKEAMNRYVFMLQYEMIKKR